MNFEQMYQSLEALAPGRLFGYESRFHDINAQNNLHGRSYYVVPSNLRFHRSRILDSGPILGGLFFALRESVSKDYQHTTRGQRWVVFDLFGELVFRPDLETITTKRAADAAFFRWREGFDWRAHYEQKRAAERARMLQAVERLPAGVTQ